MSSIHTLSAGCRRWVERPLILGASKASIMILLQPCLLPDPVVSGLGGWEGRFAFRCVVYSVYR